MIENLFEGIKKAGYTKLGFGFGSLLAFLLGVSSVGFALLGIFIYINANTIYKSLNGIKI